MCRFIYALTVGLMATVARAGQVPMSSSAPPPPPPVAKSVSPSPDAARPPIEGQLAHVGRLELVPKESGVGVRVGYEYLNGVDYARLTPEIDIRSDRFELGIAAPLRFEMCSGATPLRGCFQSRSLQLAPYPNRYRFRAEDYRTYSDYVRTIRYLRYGRKEESLHLDVTRIDATTIGQGGLIRRYSPSVNPDTLRVSADLGAQVDFGGLEAFTNDIARPNIWAFRGFLKPLAFVSGNSIARSLSLGVTYAIDRDPPKVLQAAAVDVELALVRTETLYLKPYVELARLLGAGNGLTLGVIAQANAQTSGGIVHTFRVTAEGRSFDANHVPGYFDTFYETEKLQYGRGSAASSKWEAISSRTGARRQGAYMEAGYSISQALALSAGLELATQPSSRSAYLHAEVPALSLLQFFATLYRRDFQGQPWFTRRAFGLPNTVVVSGARLKLLPILFVNGAFAQTQVLDGPTGRFQTERRVSGDLEIGFGF
jgi:hypothetical protein